MATKTQAFVTAGFVTLLAGLTTHLAQAQAQQSRRGAQMRFQGMDSNRDGRVSRSEWRGSDDSFRQHDWNNDGVLSGEEVQVGAARAVSPDDDYDQAQRPQFRNWTERGFANLDRNRDGRVARNEWFYDREGFVRADRNGDGGLTREEFLSGDVDSDREDRFDYLDANRNGRIERTEWHASRDAFEWLDRNNDGVLSQTEVVGEPAEQADLFGGLDANNDDRVTADEWQWSRRSFARQDQNGDGELTRGELTNAEVSAARGTNGGAGTSGASGSTSQGPQVIVDAARGWVDTGYDLRAGDVVSIQASGTATLSTAGSDVAEPAGSRTNRRATSAPLPNESAGALIARIGNAAPMIVGSRRTITANTAGRLYLSVNDDFFDDNRGQYQVMIVMRP
jgi:Ca2+-binding EF-hand superfamily protein